MKTLVIAATTSAIVLGTTALAGPVEDLIAQLEAEGYTQIEVEAEDGMTEIEGVLDGMEREITIDADGNILSDETEAEDEVEDEEEDDADDEDGEDKDEKDDS